MAERQKKCRRLFTGLFLLHHTSILRQGVISHVALFLGQREAHVFAGMVIPQDADAHPFVSGNLLEFGNVNVILVIHPYRSLDRLVIRAVTHRYGDIALPQFLNHLIAETSPFFFPEPDAGFQLGQISLPCTLGKGAQQEFHERFPCIALGQAHVPAPHRLRATIDAREIDSVHPPDHPSPHLRVNDLVQGEAFNGLADERACHTLAVKADTGLVIEVVQTVVVPTELAVRHPDIRSLLVKKGIHVIYPVIYPGTPFIIFILFLHAPVDGAPAVITLLRADTDQTAGTPDSLFRVQPP